MSDNIPCVDTDVDLTAVASKSIIVATDASNATHNVTEDSDMVAKSEMDNHVNGLTIEDVSSAKLKLQTKFSIWKNHLILCFTYMFLVTANSSFEAMQSSLNTEEGLGVVGLALIYATFGMSSLLVVVFTTSRFNNKRIMLISIVSYMAYICTGFYSSWATVVPATILIGIGAGHLWVVQQTYTSTLAKRYAEITHTKVDDTYPFFFGTFYGLFSQRYIYGNLASSLTMPAAQGNLTESIESCGVNFCPGVLNSTQIQPPTTQQLYMYVGILLGFECLALIIPILFLTDLTELPDHKPSAIASVKAVVWHFYKSREQKLLSVASMYRGLQVAFIVGDFSMAFVSCPLGIRYVGFVIIAFGTTSIILSILFGKLAKYTGFIPLFIIGTAGQLTVTVTLLLWEVDRTQPEIIFVLAILWGIGDAVYTPMVVSMHSSLFPGDERSAAFSTFRVLDAFGYAVSFILTSFLCMRPKIVFMMVVMSVSLVLVINLQCTARKNRKKPRL